MLDIIVAGKLPRKHEITVTELKNNTTSDVTSRVGEEENKSIGDILAIF